MRLLASRACTALCCAAIAVACGGDDDSDDIEAAKPGNESAAGTGRSGAGGSGAGNAGTDATSGAGAGAGAGGQSHSSGCGEGTLAAGLQTVTIEHEGMQRSYQRYVPEGLDPEAPVPLMLNFHGFTSNTDAQIAFSGMNTTADREGFIVAYPEGLGAAFNAGKNCCSAYGNPPHMADDVDFARAIIDDIAAKGCIDRRRVYATGMSNGGYMAEYLACEAADVFAAVAPVGSMVPVRTDCTPSRPIAVIEFNGTEDPFGAEETFVAAFTAWRKRNGCSEESTRTEFGASYCDLWDDCAEGVALQHCTLTGMGHCWPGTAFCVNGDYNLEISANDEMWEFLRHFSLPL